MLASRHQPAWASKSPSSPSSPAMFPPQQIAGLFAKGIFKQPLLVGAYPIFILENTRNPWGAPKIGWHDESKKMRSLSLQIPREVTWL